MSAYFSSVFTNTECPPCAGSPACRHTEGELTAPHQCISALPHWVDSRHRDKKTGDARPCTGRNGKDGTVLRTGIAEGGTGRQAGLALGSHHSKSSVRIHCTPGAGQAGHTAVSKRGAMAAARPVGLSCSRRCSRGRRHLCSLPREAGGRCRRDPRPKFYTGLLPAPLQELCAEHPAHARGRCGERAESLPIGTCGAHRAGGSTAHMGISTQHVRQRGVRGPREGQEGQRRRRHVA